MHFIHEKNWKLLRKVYNYLTEGRMKLPCHQSSSESDGRQKTEWKWKRFPLVSRGR
jgi:hypothetical protein